MCIAPAENTELLYTPQWPFQILLRHWAPVELTCMTSASANLERCIPTLLLSHVLQPLNEHKMRSAAAQLGMLRAARVYGRMRPTL